MVQFNIDSRHVREARFKKVLFGYDGVLLEVELNEMQDIQNTRFADLIDVLFRDRPLYVGSYTIASGQLTVENEVVAANGDIIIIPSARISVNSGDTIYLNVKEKVITHSDVIRKDGYEYSPDVIPNYLIDDRHGEETTRRIQRTFNLTKTNTGDGLFIPLGTVQGSTFQKRTFDDSPFYTEIRRLTLEEIAKKNYDTLIVEVSNALDAHRGSGGDAHKLASASEAGFMSPSQFTKLQGIATGAEVNQNAFSHVKVGSSTASADSKTDTFEISAGTGVILTLDTANDKLTISLDSSYIETASGAQAKVDEHANNKNNPHNVTKSQVGLGNVENYGVASTSEAQTGTANNKYMTPLRTKEAIDVFAPVKSVAGKTGAVTLTKSDVGLSNVQNYGIATQTEAEAGTASNKYMTPERTKQAIDVFAPVKSVAGKTGAVTLAKSDVGLGNVPNYPAATQAQAQAGSDNASLMTPLRTKEAIDALSPVKSVAGKTGAVTLSKSDVGLGSVQNYAVATQTEAEAGSSDQRYMTPLKTKQAIDALSPVKSVAGKTGTVTLSKSDVELGSVQNYGIATQAEAEAGTSSSKYMTPQRTNQAIQALAPVKSVAGKTGAVTLSKSDVGLGSVQNYAIASQSEAQAGSSNERYMTPLRVKNAIDALSPVKSVNGKTGTINISKSDLRIFVQQSPPSNPQVGDLWIW